MCDGIFVYGTLMSGFINHDLYLAEHIVTMQPAKIKGRLFHLPVGYPAALDGEGWVTGELVAVKEMTRVLAQLDELEDYYGPGQNNEYERVLRDVAVAGGSDLRGYVYLYAAGLDALMTAQGREVPSGNWRTFMQNSADRA